MLDLFTLQVDKEKLHHNFIQLLNDNYPYARDLLTDWTDGFVDRDHKIVKEFQTSFNSTFWELYLYNLFKKFNFEIDFSYSSPDFVIKSPYNLCVEAVTTNNALGTPTEYSFNYNNDKFPDSNQIIKTAVIRIANSIIQKYKKFQSNYSKLPHVQHKPFILALAPFEQPFFWVQHTSAINRVLYGLEGFSYLHPENPICTEITGTNYNFFIEKDNGSEIQLGFFSNNQMEEISAILFSNLATFGKVRALTKNKDPRTMLFSYSRYDKNGFHPKIGFVDKSNYEESLEDGICLFLNPFAKYPLEDKFIKKFPAVQTFDYSCNMPIGDCNDGQLIERMELNLNFKKD